LGIRASDTEEGQGMVFSKNDV